LETIPELPQGARVRRKPQLPVQVGGGGRGGDEEEEEKAPSTIEHLLSAGRGPKDGEKELGAMVTSHDEDDGGSECSESDEDSSEGDASPSVAKDRLRSRIALEERQNSRRFSSVETTNLRAMLPKEKPKTQRKPKTVRVLDPVEPLDAPRAPSRDLVFERGAVTTLAKIRDNFYPGRHTQMISKAVHARVDGCEYIREQKHFLHVKIVHLDPEPDQESQDNNLSNNLQED